MSSPIKIGYVPEHFSSPLLLLAQKDKSIELIACPSELGQPSAGYPRLAGPGPRLGPPLIRLIALLWLAVQVGPGRSRRGS